MSRSCPRRPPLNQYFLGAVAIILLCSFGLGAAALSGYYQTYENSALGLSRLLAFRTVLDASLRASNERGPTNAALGRNLVGDSARAGGLELARQATDAAIARLESSSELAEPLGALKQQLRRTRADVDTLLDRPWPERDPASVEQAINGMFAAYDLAQPLAGAAMTSMITHGSDRTGQAINARMIGELRDYSGRLGSYIVIAIAQGHPMTPEQKAAFFATKGRVLQLWQLLQQQIAVNGSPKVLEALRDTERGFMQDGLLLIETARNRLEQGDIGLTTPGFTQAVVPTFAPIERLRAAYLDMTTRELEGRRDAAERALAFAAAATVITLAIELLLLLAGQRLLFSPLLQAREEVMRLADGQIEQAVATPFLRGEMRSLFDALVTLREKLIERDRLDADRSRLEQQLRRQADTDGLTGVLNRGALERLVPHLAKTAEPTGLILLDLDHFKSVNDRHGHTAGDAVLRSAAQRLRAALREEDVLARFGGEEFAILVTARSGEPLATIATRLRQVIEAEPFDLPGGQMIALTASLGTATATAHAEMWLALLKAADAALYEAKTLGRNRVVASGGG
ncbi:GGDEF domain-containing protein [Bosea thiooxidans]|nr:GGDEF domain-containing protein [Bosea sp. (in: a-proteobacteria)]